MDLFCPSRPLLHKTFFRCVRISRNYSAAFKAHLLVSRLLNNNSLSFIAQNHVEQLKLYCTKPVLCKFIKATRKAKALQIEPSLGILAKKVSTASQPVADMCEHATKMGQ